MSNGIYVRVNGQWEEVSTTEDNVVGKIENAKNEAIDESKSYTDNKISEIPDVDLSALETKEDATAKLTEAKEYTDKKISTIPEVDLTPLETKEDAQAKLTEAKQYTDEKIGDVDLSALETKEDATAKLEEAKSYTDEEIAKLPVGTYIYPKGTEIDPHALPKTVNNPNGEVARDGYSFVGYYDLTASNQKEWESFIKQYLPDFKWTGSPGFLFYNVVNSEGNTIFAKRTIIQGLDSVEMHLSSTVDDWVSIRYSHQARGIYQKNNINNYSSNNILGENNNAGYSSEVTVIGKNNTLANSLTKRAYIIGHGNSFSENKIIDSFILGQNNKQGESKGNQYLMGNSLVGSSSDYTITLGRGNLPKASQRLIVGNGTAHDGSNALTLSNSGDLNIQGEYKTGGADYAEMFEWGDRNPENIDRVALAVTWGDGESIKLANSGDEIIGIASATAAILGDNPDEWDKRFVTDQFGRPLRKEYTEINENGEEETYEWFVENPEYDKDAPYVSRSERPEWSAVGLMGKLYWIDDGTLEVGDYATVGSNGVATKGDKSNGWRVMKRISKNVDGNSGVVKVFFK